MNRSVLHLDLDAFFVSVERLYDSSLKGKPLIIGGHSDRAVVSSCSYEARAFGVKSAMPVKAALRLCPNAAVVKGSMGAYFKHSKIVTDILLEEAPLVQKSSIDEFYLDLTGMDQYIGTWNWSKELRRKIIKESGLPISMGLAVNKLVSKIATGEAKPNGEIWIHTGEEKAYLAPLSIKKIPSIGKATYSKLRFMGIEKVYQLSETPKELLVKEFGNKQGNSLWNKANGIDHSPVTPYRERKSISTERTFHKDTKDKEMLSSLITDMCMKLAYQLREKNKLSAEIGIKIRYKDFSTFSKQRAVSPTFTDSKIIEMAIQLFHELYNDRSEIRLVGVRLGKLKDGDVQLNLFDETEKEDALLDALDDIRKKHGLKSITRASTLKKKK